METISSEIILNALQSILVPSAGQSVTDLGLVSGILIKQGNVGFTLNTEPNQVKEMEGVRKRCEEEIRKIPGVLSVTVVLTSERPRSDAAAAPGGGSTARDDAPTAGDAELRRRRSRAQRPRSRSSTLRSEDTMA